MNARMPQLQRCFEEAGFQRVRTVLSSGNVVFDSRALAQATLERRAEEAMERSLGRAFRTTVRSVEFLQALVASDPFRPFHLPPEAKCVVSFLRRPREAALRLPIERRGASILKIQGTEVLTAYLPSTEGPVFMQLLETTFGKDITTRTLDTIRKCAAA